MLADYPGTVLLVSHDRDFLARICSSVLASEGHGRWQLYAGGYSDMVAQRGEGVSAKAAARAEKAARTEEERSEEHTSELQSLMRSSYAVFCLNKTRQQKQTN